MQWYLDVSQIWRNLRPRLTIRILVAHPVIHLGYAYELNSKTVAMEALTLGACFHDSLHKYADDSSYTRPASYKTSDPLEIVQRIYADERFDGLLDHQGSDNFGTLLEKREDAVLDHWNAWEVDEANLADRFEKAQRAAVTLVVGSRPEGKRYDFFLLHALTSSHALRILLPHVPEKFHISLVRQWYLFVILAYIGQLRPKVNLDVIEDFEPEKGKDTWKYVQYEAVNGKYATDAHWVKGLRAMMVAEETWGDDDGWWRKAACRLAVEFDGWGGFDHRTAGYKARS